MKTLILTEKPSVARDFSKAIQKSPRKADGFIEDEKYLITWAIGHLVELFEPDDYDTKWKKWSFNTLPVIPEKFRYKPVETARRQLEIIKRILSEKKFDSVIIATDAGREGEVIARTILISSDFMDEKGSGTDKIQRFWTSQALTNEVINDGLKNLIPSTSYDRLWKAGQSRQIADWLVGMNSSRAATLKMNDLFSVGRVQTAVLSLIVKRCIERNNFKPEPYYLLYAVFEDDNRKYRGIWFKNKSNRFDTLESSEKAASKIKDKEANVKSVKRVKKKQAPPELFSLTDLQREANTKFGYTAKRTLDIAQNLYETKKCLSYPRTDSRVMGSKNVQMVKNLVVKFQSLYGRYFKGVDLKLISNSNKRVFNDAKLTDHHALIPLKSIPDNANEDEKKIFGLVVKRFAAVFHCDLEFEQTEIITVCENENFRSRGKVILNPGWQDVYKDDKNQSGKSDDDEQDEDLPKLEKGEIFNVKETEIKSKKTSPQPLYTEATLLKDMTNPGKYVEEKDLKKIYRGETGLGTQATRAQIIETLLLRKYILRDKKSILATEKGEVLIRTLKKLSSASSIIEPDETARWEMELEKIARGEAESEPFILQIKDFVNSIVSEFKDLPAQNSVVAEDAEIIADCPTCKGKIIENSKAFGCSNWKSGCGFVIWKEIAGKKITKDIVEKLVKDKISEPISGFVSKKGGNFSARLSVSESTDWKVRFVFTDDNIKNEKKNNNDNEENKEKEYENRFGNCPSCGGIVIEGKKGYGCSNWPEDKGSCKFVIWKIISGYRLTEEDLITLLKGEVTDEKIFDKDLKTEFKAKLGLRKIPGNFKNENRILWETEFVY